MISAESCGNPWACRVSNPGSSCVAPSSLLRQQPVPRKSSMEWLALVISSRMNVERFRRSSYRIVSGHSTINQVELPRASFRTFGFEIMGWEVSRSCSCADTDVVKASIQISITLHLQEIQDFRSPAKVADEVHIHAHFVLLQHA